MQQENCLDGTEGRLNGWLEDTSRCGQNLVPRQTCTHCAYKRTLQKKLKGTISLNCSLRETVGENGTALYMQLVPHMYFGKFWLKTKRYIVEMRNRLGDSLMLLVISSTTERQIFGVSCEITDDTGRNGDDVMIHGIRAFCIRVLRGMFRSNLDIKLSNLM